MNIILLDKTRERASFGIVPSMGTRHWHDPSMSNLHKDFEAKWAMDIRLGRGVAVEICMRRGLDAETGTAVHMVLLAFLEREKRAPSETAEPMDCDDTGSSKSGLEPWKLFKYNFDVSPEINISCSAGIDDMP